MPSHYGKPAMKRPATRSMKPSSDRARGLLKQASKSHLKKTASAAGKQLGLKRPGEKR